MTKTAETHIDSLLDGIKEPTTCKGHTRSAMLYINKEFGILPYRFGVTKEQTIVATFRNDSGTKHLGVEVYDDADVVVVVSESKEIIGSAMLGDADCVALIEKFNK